MKILSYILLLLSFTIISCDEAQESSVSTDPSITGQTNFNSSKEVLKYESIYNEIIASGGQEISFPNDIINLDEIDFFGYDNIKLLLFNGQYILLIQYNEGNENYAANAAECDKKLLIFKKDGKISSIKCQDSGNECQIVPSEESLTIHICS